MEAYVLRSTVRPIYIAELLPEGHLFTPFRWGSFDQAKIMTEERAKTIQEALTDRGIDTILQDVSQNQDNNLPIVEELTILTTPEETE